MSWRIPALVGSLSLFAAADVVSAQTRSRPASPVVQQASLAVGRILGTVRDDAGEALGGVSVVAVGATVAAATTDAAGRFVLPLAPGDYILRASRDGYVSTFRETVRVQTSARLERHITLIRAEVAAPVLLASAVGTGVTDQLSMPAETTGHSHSATAWRLRNLTRSVLRDAGPAARVPGDRTEAADLQPAGSFFDRVWIESARAASAFFADTDFTGQVNVLTTSSVTRAGGWQPQDWSNGIAYVAVGAPVGQHGDWAVRGALTAGDPSSWVLAGEYRTRADHVHAFRAGVSYGIQGDLSARLRGRTTGSDTRSVGATWVFDAWRVRPGLEVDYGVRVDRYDYVAESHLASPEAGVRVAVLPGLRVSARASRRAVAPGRNEFLPPVASGPWLPPDRTFAPLVGGQPFQTERVDHVEVGVERTFGPAAAGRTVSLHRFQQTARNQIATLFGLGVERSAGHYYVARAGDADLSGWALRFTGRLMPGLAGTVDYSASTASWTGSPSRRLRRVSPSSVRDGVERLHGVTMTLDANIEETATRVTMAWRVSSRFAHERPSDAVPRAGSRFDVEVHQALPYQPIRGSRIELLVAVRTLFHDLREAGSMFDELLTVAPPMRLMGGLQLRF